MEGAQAELAHSWNAYRWASLPSGACFAGDSLRMKNESFDLEQNHSLYHQLMQVLHITCLEVQAKAILEENKYTQASDRHKNAEGVWARDQIEPSEHLWTKINNPIAAVSGCPQALDSLNYLSVVARWGQGCLPLSVCLRAETSERVSSITALPTAPRSSISSLLLQPDHSTVSQLICGCQSSLEC